MSQSVLQKSILQQSVLKARFAGSDVLMFLRDLALKSAQGLEQISFAILRNREPRAGTALTARSVAAHAVGDEDLPLGLGLAVGFGGIGTARALAKFYAMP